MTAQGGKRLRDVVVNPTPSPFAPLTPLSRSASTSVADSLAALSKALANCRTKARIHLRLVKDETFEHWEVEAGTPSGAARQRQPKTADVHVAMKPEIWQQIAQGRLSPFDALFAGKLRVGGEVALAKQLVKHLSDPSVPFVSPC